MIKQQLELIEIDMDTYCEDLGGDFLFSFDDDNEASFSVFDVELMEDEDDFKDDVICTFQEYGIEPKSAEWDYDCGNEFDQICKLIITF